MNALLSSTPALEVRMCFNTVQVLQDIVFPFGSIYLLKLLFHLLQSFLPFPVYLKDNTISELQWEVRLQTHRQREGEGETDRKRAHLHELKGNICVCANLFQEKVYDSMTAAIGVCM